MPLLPPPKSTVQAQIHCRSPLISDLKRQISLSKHSDEQLGLQTTGPKLHTRAEAALYLLTKLATDPAAEWLNAQIHCRSPLISDLKRQISLSKHSDEQLGLQTTGPKLHTRAEAALYLLTKLATDPAAEWLNVSPRKSFLSLHADTTVKVHVYV
ncbi:hypothetical protein TREES_T100008301 [Tupaia chinensis]|uniref:Uncharacterized protein n=1 Tax=Tupaia chinensis TaxID=246437 RepID=L9LBD3_TUPCH|nr:hypothetical protein TREES_T100008301 [Tupaia chinensis]